MWQKVENEMEQTTPGRTGNKFLPSIACLFSFSRDTRIYAKCNTAEMAPGYCSAPRSVCVCVWVYNWINEQWQKQWCKLACTSYLTLGFQKCKTCKSSAGTLEWKRPGDVSQWNQWSCCLGGWKKKWSIPNMTSLISYLILYSHMEINKFNF